MSGHQKDVPEAKGITRDFLRLPARAEPDDSLISSSPRAKKKGNTPNERPCRVLSGL